ncbi:MAG: type II secretion system F family protein [Actinomycetota bacterium]
MNPDKLLVALAGVGRYVPDGWPVWQGGVSEGAPDAAARGAGLIACLAGVILLPKPFAYAVLIPIYFVGTRAPALIRQAAMERRGAAIDAALPDLADLMTLLAEAGISISRALPIAAEEANGPLRERLDAALAQIEIGAARQEALLNSAAVSPSKELKAFAGLFAEADRYGTPIAAALRAFSDDARDKQLCRAREEAQKLPIKMLFPLVFMILPAFMLLTAGPLVVSLI